MPGLSPVQMVLSAKLAVVGCYVVSLAMAEFISNSAILTTVRPQRRAYRSGRIRLRTRKMADLYVKSDIVNIPNRR